jgi:4-carboxymuconolactone decarboxylase
MKSWRIAIAIVSTIATIAARAEERLPTIPPAQYTEEQKQAAADFESARKVPVFGPFEPLMYSPQVMSQARAMGDYLRYKSAIGNTLSELVILMTARAWTQDYEWAVHYPIALKAGIRKEVADDIAVGRRPTAMSPDEETVFDFTSELLTNKQVSDATFKRAKARLGMKGVVDMTGIVGYYTFLAMQLTSRSTRSQSTDRSFPECLASSVPGKQLRSEPRLSFRFAQSSNAYVRVRTYPAPQRKLGSGK